VLITQTNYIYIVKDRDKTVSFTIGVTNPMKYWEDSLQYNIRDIIFTFFFYYIIFYCP